jgi:hypothetical protein
MKERRYQKDNAEYEGNREKGTEEGNQRMRDKVAVDKGPRKKGWGKEIGNWGNETWNWVQGTKKGK